jgi:hypothetical protein
MKRNLWEWNSILRDRSFLKTLKALRPFKIFIIIGRGCRQLGCFRISIIKLKSLSC